MSAVPALASSDPTAHGDAPSGRSVGLIFIAIFVGTIAAIVGLVVGASWWMALCLYVSTGFVAMLILALRLAFSGDDPADPLGPEPMPNGAIYAKRGGGDELLA